MKPLCTLLLHLGALSIYATTLSEPALPAATAVGGCYTTLSDPVGNPAAAPKQLALSAHYWNLYGVPELSQGVIAFHYKTPYLTTGLTANHFGLKQYYETQVGITLSRTFSPYIAFGLQANYIHLQYSNTSVNTGNLSLGIQIYPTTKLTLGATLYNGSFSHFRKGILPVQLRLGSKYEFTHYLWGALEVDYELHGTLGIHAGLCYTIAKRIGISAGIRYKETLLPTLGIQVYWAHWSAQVAMDYDWQLGIQSGMSIRYCL